MARSTRPGTTVVVLLGLLAGYLTFDAFDVVPGMLTTSEPWPQAAPFPAAPGAVEVPAPGTAFAVLPQSAPKPGGDDIDALVEGLAGDDRLGSRVGVMVVDAITGETLGAAGQDVLMTPASTQKLLTGVAALSSPLADRTLPTTVLHQDGTITLVGGGDMMLAAGKGDPDEVLGRAGLADLADQVAPALKAAGTTKVRLELDDTLFTGPGVSPSVEKANREYVGDATPIAVNIGVTGEHYTSQGPWADDPARRAAETFAKRLKERGITVGKIARGTASDGAEKVGEVRSASVPEITEYFLHTSNNTITEVMCRLVAVESGAKGSIEDGTQAVVDAVESLGVDLDGAKLEDCSGLGKGSRLSVEQLAAVVQLTIDPAHSVLREVAVGMPIGGLDGTLQSRFTGTAPARGLVRAKTGSLVKTRALAGTVVTADQRQLVFVVVADSIPPGGTIGAQWIFDDFVDDLADFSAEQPS